VRGEGPPPEVVLVRVPVPVHDAHRVRRAEEADQGLHLVPGHRVAHEGQVLAAHLREERPGVERRQAAPGRLPPPVEVARVGTPVADAVVALLHVAQRAVVPPRVHPLPLRIAAVLRPAEIQPQDIRPVRTQVNSNTLEEICNIYVLRGDEGVLERREHQFLIAGRRAADVEESQAEEAEGEPSADGLGHEAAMAAAFGIRCLVLVTMVRPHLEKVSCCGR
jgi:hypothetical protein